MNADELRARQAPVKQAYRDNPASGMKTLRVEGSLGMESLVCNVRSKLGTLETGMHPAAGGDAKFACSGDMLLEALVGCAGVTVTAVATALKIPIRGGVVRAEGDLDFRGTLGVGKETPVGFQAIRLYFDLDADATPEQLDQLIGLAKRYCVIYQSLVTPPTITTTVNGQ